MATFHKLLVLVLVCIVTDALGQTTAGSTTAFPDLTTAAAPVPTTAAAPVPTTAGSATDAPDQTTAFQLPTDDIILKCGPDSMTVEIPTKLLTDGVKGEDLTFENSDCVGVEGNDHIVLNTPLTGCGTIRTEDGTDEVYSNMVINSETNATISRQYKVEIPVNCSYSRSGNVSQPWYKLTDYVLDKDLKESGKYSFDLTFYDGNNFDSPIDGYPYLVNLDDELNFAATLGSEEYKDLDLSIESCHATPVAAYDSETQYPLITGWSADEGTDISCFSESDPSNIDMIRVTTHAFRFIEFEGDEETVYIHCDLYVCETSDIDSQCEGQCSDSTGSDRRRRDVSLDSPPLPVQRLTRGPIRFRRAAPVLNVPQGLEIHDGGNSGVQVSMPLTMWGLVVVVMGSVVIVLLAALVVTLRKLATTKHTTTTRKDDEADVGLLHDKDSD